jgi:hypothetical protein
MIQSTKPEDPMLRLIAAGSAECARLLQRYKEGAYVTDAVAAYAITQAILAAMQAEEDRITLELESTDVQH